MASLPVRYPPLAANELAEVLDWYARRDPAVAARFSELYIDKLKEAARSPQHWPLQPDGTRQIHLRPFPYVLIVRERSGCLEVVAIAHASRRPGYWTDRLE
jgi:plasmid stabilization system protein ParE